jgi:C_GCAxxG_C_C family probable redox protein
MKNKIETAVHKFTSGYNCAQSVLFAYSDEIDIEKNTALKIAWAFGAGMGRKQEICGAVTGGIMAISLKHSRFQNEDNSTTEKIYLRTRELMDRFRKKHGTCKCSELLQGCNLLTEEGQKYFKENDLFNKTCVECVRSVSCILEEIL